MPANSLQLLAALAPTAGLNVYPSQCPSALPAWLDQAAMVALGDVVINRLELRKDGLLLWNGMPVAADKVAEYADLVTRMNPQPLTALAIDTGAPCDKVRAIRELIDKQARCKSGRVCGEGAGPAPQPGH